MAVITGDSPNALLARMDADGAAEPLPPFEDERIVVQSLGMERWVRQQLALRRGCAASLDLPFPAAFCRTLSEQLQRAHDGSFAGGIDARFEEQALIWRVFALLGNEALLADPVYAPLRDFLTGADEAKRYGLAVRIAGRFDEYRLYRPHLLLAWEDGREGLTDNPHEGWQASLWRALLGGERPQHFARWFLRTLDRLRAAETRPDGLPARVSVFGVSTLPPLFVELLRAAARFVPVRVYVLAPDAHSWREGAPRHPLFESFGAASRALLTTLTAPDVHGVRPPVTHVATPAYCDTSSASPSAPSLLHRLQHDLRAAHTGPPHQLAPHDRSLSVHVCYSPMREMEMLRDQLLDAFAADPTLRPHDVLVMVPDVELYAPLAEAIFGDPRTNAGRDDVAGGGDQTKLVIPFRVADRALVREAAPARALLAYLALVNARCTASEVIGLLSMPVVRRAATLTPAQLDQVATWVEEAAIRWGYDGATRAAGFDLPAVEDNSWRAGLDRLLTGYATGRTETLVTGVLPLAGDLVGDTELLGCFAEWVDSLFARLAALRADRPLTAWSALLQDTASWLVKPEGADEQAAFDRLLRDLTRLGDLAEAQGHGFRAAGAAPAPGAPVSFEVVRAWLDTTLATDEHANNFLAGGVTICAMKPMRAIPHRVIAMLGLDDKAYPRRTRRAAFDLIGSEPAVGDRDARTDDRQLLLDTLMSAGDRLLLSYVGRSQKNNAEIAPSIVIAELLDFIDAQVAVPASVASAASPVGAVTTPTPPRRPSTHLRVEHRLQPFSPEYFREDVRRDTRLFSFDAELARSVTLAANPARGDAPPFLSAIPAVPELWRDLATVVRPADPQIIALADLIEAWVNPARLYCRRVLQLHARGDDPVLEDVEPMTVDALLATSLQQEMVEQVLAGRRDLEADRARMVASGRLPAGALGAEWYDTLHGDIASLLTQLGTPTFGEPFAVDLTGPDWRLVGQLDLQREGEQWRVRAATLKPKDMARAWIVHVVRNAAGAPATTRVFAKDCTFTLPPLPAALSSLDLLVQGYRAALAAPVPYFIEAAHEYRKAQRRTRQTADPRQAAEDRYKADGSTMGARGDLADPYVALLWRGRQPIVECWDDFRRLADAFWTPIDTLTDGSDT